MTYDEAFLLALSGLAANAQVCARSWSPENLANRAAAIAEAACKRIESGRDLAPDTVSTRELETRHLMQDFKEILSIVPGHHKDALLGRIERWLEDCG